jgi:DNA-binding SARP family transcriptional activator/tetratricopeptide (TPR) repeat protein
VTRRRPAPDLDIRLLGPPVILVRGAPLEVDTRKAVAIIALLAAERRPFARDELGALLWPESGDLAARGALRRTLSTLRSAVGDRALQIDRVKVELVPRLVQVDLSAIEVAARSDDPATLATAAALVRGPFLAGFNLRDSPEFDDWRAARAVSVERSILGVLDRLAVAAEADDDLPRAIDAASRRLDLDPLDEAAHVRLMELLDAAGDRSGALRQYRACVATLERELGVAPLATTTARYEAIRDRPPRATPQLQSGPRPRGDATRNTQPGRSSTSSGAGVDALPLVGRDDALDVVETALSGVGDAGGRAVVLVGEAGIGKTRLGEIVTAKARSAGATVLMTTAYPAERSIAYGPIVDLLRAALDLPDAAARTARLSHDTRAELGRLLPAFGPDHGGPRDDGPGSHARLVAAIASGLERLVADQRPGIVWLDDAHFLDPASREALEYLVHRLARHRLLILFAWRPEDLDADGQAFAERIAASPATSVVGLDRLSPTQVAALVAARGRVGLDKAFTDQLVSASEGLPLYVVEVLADDHPMGAGALPSGVRSVVRDRLMTVSETTMQVLAAGSVIGRSFDPDTVRHASGRNEDEVADAIDEAIRRGLIRERGVGFDFSHGAIRDVVHEMTSLTRRRLLHRRVAEALRLDLAGSGRADLARLVLIATHERAAGRDAAAAIAYQAAGDRAAAIFANRDAIDLLESALALDHPDPVGIHGEIGRLRTRVGDYDGAITALEAAAAAGSARDLPDLEWALGRAYLRRGDLVAAAHHLDAAAEGLDDDALLARIWVDRSVVRRRSGDRTGAIEAARDALGAAERAGDRPSADAAHRMLGLAALDDGRYGAAITELQRSLEGSRDDPDPTARIAALTALAMAESQAGTVDVAIEHGEEAVAICRRIGDRHLEAAVENHLADILHAAGREAGSMEHLRRAVEAFSEFGGDPADPDPGIWMLSAS